MLRLIHQGIQVTQWFNNIFGSTMIKPRKKVKVFERLNHIGRPPKEGGGVGKRIRRGVKR